MDTNGSNTRRKYENSMPVTDEGWWEVRAGRGAAAHGRVRSSL